MLDRDRWDRLQELFHAAADRPRAEWEAILDRGASGDAALKARVLAMLEADAGNGSMLDRGSPAVAAGLMAGQSAVGRMIGPYRLTRLLGEGGMGVVYLAVRDDLGTTAAVKLLRDAWVSPGRRDRFAAEQRTLATLSHPAIARLLDAGTLDDGTPWIVMEPVEGVPITTACRDRALGLRERLQLFRQVCEAVHHAHQRLVVHRDVKPSNILVTTDGAVKLLDFGIAKSLEPYGGGAERTLTGLRLMTPAYAAPEQVRGDPVGVFTDVYALGVVLYELLSGRLPHDLSSRTPGEVERSILQDIPPRVSQAARSGAPVSATASQWQDLDVLCGTAMHKEPARRYASVEALVRDIDHFLAREPLEARPDSLRYRASRFVSRNRGPVAATAAALALLALVNALYLSSLTSARDAARAEAARAARIQRFVTRLFQGGEGSEVPAESLRVLGLVDRGVQEARSLTSEPRVQAELLQTLGGIYQKLGNLDRADSLLGISLAAWSAVSGDSSSDVATGLVALAQLRADQARYAEAESLARAGLALASTRLPAGHPRHAEALEALGRVLVDRGDYDAAIPVLRDAVQHRAEAGVETVEYAGALYELANANFYAGQYDVSDSLNRQVLALHQRLLGERHPSVADDLVNLGAGQFERANYGDAERYYRQALDITQGHFGRDHFRTASNLTMLGRSLVMQKRFDEATAALDQALAIRERVYGPVHPAVASTVNELGSIALQRERYGEAEAAYRRMLGIYRSVYRDGHYLIGIAQSNLASVYMARGENAEAESIFRDAIATYERTLAPGHTNTAIARIKLGRTLLRQAKYAEAEHQSRAGYEILKPQLNPSASWLVSARADLAKAYDALKRPDEAARVRAESATVAAKPK